MLNLLRLNFEPQFYIRLCEHNKYVIISAQNNGDYR